MQGAAAADCARCACRVFLNAIAPNRRRGGLSLGHTTCSPNCSPRPLEEHSGEGLHTKVHTLRHNMKATRGKDEDETLSLTTDSVPHFKVSLDVRRLSIHALNIAGFAFPGSPGVPAPSRSWPCHSHRRHHPSRLPPHSPPPPPPWYRKLRRILPHRNEAGRYRLRKGRTRNGACRYRLRKELKPGPPPARLINAHDTLTTPMRMARA